MKLKHLYFVALTLLVGACQAVAQGTAFTYQGRLNEGGSPANGSYDLQFTLFATDSGGTLVAGPLTNNFTSVSNGLFSVTLDFDSVFADTTNWLEIGLRTNGNDAFIPLTPRQQITPTPQAIYARNAGSVLAANIVGTIPDSRLSANVPLLNGSNAFSGAVLFSNMSNSFSGSFTGNGANISNLNLTHNSSGTISWQGRFVLTSSPIVPVNSKLGQPADVNGDGWIDLVVARYNGLNVVTVLTNNGSGVFGFNASLDATSPSSVAAADVNADGAVDLICANIGDDNLLVLTNNGSGVFGSNTTLNVGDFPYAVIAADINGDGSPDLISANQTANSISVLTNDGHGVFGSNATLNVGTYPDSVAAVDINGDNRLDLISANYVGNTLSVFTNSSTGVFGSNATLNVGSYPSSVVAADVNSDGKSDLITANGADNNLSVMINDGNGSFVLGSSPPVGGGPVAVVAADVNGDGKVDLISANSGTFGAPGNSLSVLTNDGSGGFVTAATYPVGLGPESVVAADVNGDGRLDLVCANFFANTLSVLFNSPTFNGIFNGDGAGLTSLNASQLTTGTVPLAQLPSAVVTNNKTGVTLSGTFNGNAGGLTNLNATNLVGTIPNARLSTNVALRNSSQTFTGSNTFSGVLVATNGNSRFAGNGAGLTNLSANAVTGGFTTNLAVLVPGGGTNTLFFTNGVLRAVQ